jgi:GNAT superfamily N-acetyltransferase
MSVDVTEYHDPDEAYEAAHDYLLERPVDHNLLHTILDQAREFSLGGRFWIVRDGEPVVGFALQSPPGMRVVLGRMRDNAIRALADAIDGSIPGVQGDAAAAALFAGHFAARRRVPVTSVEAQRLYELMQISGVVHAPGAARLATPNDRLTLADWMRAFAAETGTPAAGAQQAVDLRIGRERFWVWEDDGPKSMVSCAEPTGGVARVGPVYTPTELRGSGYATACVHHVSQLLTDRGLRCILYTQLDNPTSNAIYQGIGYAPIAEILTYNFAAV